MSNSLLKFDTKTVTIGLIILLTAVEMFVLFSVTPADPDLYGHLTFGTEILKRGSLPERDIYSYTAGRTRWINHEWLSEVLFASVWKTSGFNGLHWLRAVFLGAYLYFFYLCFDLLTDKPGLEKYVFFSGLLGLALYPYMFVRPQLITFLFTQILLYLFLSYFLHGSKVIYLMPVLLALWSNVHGGFIAGLGLIAVAAVTILVIEPGRAKVFWVLAFTSGLGTLVNPYGYYIYEQLSRTFSNPYTDRVIQDWQSILSPDVLSHPIILLTLAIYFLYTYRFTTSTKTNARILLFNLTSISVVVGLADVRNMVFVVLIGLPALAELFPGLAGDIESLTSGRVLSGLLVLVVLLGVFGRAEPNPDGYFPEDSVNYLKSENITGNLAVPFNWGQYCIFHLHPSMKVSMDGRYDTVYPLEVFEDFVLKAYQGKNWKSILRRYGTDYVLVPKDYPLHRDITDTESAETLYSGEVASVFRLRSRDQ